jgi:hypothetical protein
MSNTVIQLKHSTETGNVPSGLVNGEIAINTFDGKLFYRDPNGVTQSIQNFPGPAGLDGEVQFNDSGDLGSSANLTFNKTTGNLSSQSVHTRTFIEFGDGTKQYTANAGPGGTGTLDQVARDTANGAFDKANSANVLAQSSFDKANAANSLAQAAFDAANSVITFDTSPPASGNTVGDRWVDSNTGIEYTWLTDQDSSQWVELGPTNIVAIESGNGGNVDLTSVSSNIVPSANVTYDLGSPTNRWRDLYLSGNTIDLGGAQLKSDANSGALLIIPIPTLEVPNPKATLVSPSGSITAIETTNGSVNVAEVESVSSSTTDAFFLNSNTVTSNVTIPSGKNAMSAGPITIAANVEVTISTGSEWTIV